MAFYISKNVVVDAIQLPDLFEPITQDVINQLVEFGMKDDNGFVEVHHDPIAIYARTKNGLVKCNPHDWLIKGDGEVYPCPNEAFTAKYKVIGQLIGLVADELAQEIRRIDGNHTMGAGELAEKLLPFLSVQGIKVEGSNHVGRMLIEFADLCKLIGAAGLFINAGQPTNIDDKSWSLHVEQHRHMMAYAKTLNERIEHARNIEKSATVI